MRFNKLKFTDAFYHHYSTENNSENISKKSFVKQVKSREGSVLWSAEQTALFEEVYSLAYGLYETV